MYSKQNSRFDYELENSWIHISSSGGLAYLIFSFVFNPPIIVFLVDIIVYHIWLKINKLSTYDHIMQKRE
jgi:hypothetical protein